MPLRKYKDEEVLLANVLGACLDAMDAGHDPEEILAHFPEQAPEVEPVLDIAVMLREAREPAICALASRRRRVCSRSRLRLHSRPA